MSSATTTQVSAQPGRAGRPGRRRRFGQQNGAGWLFVAPVLVILGLFLLLPIIMAVWVSLIDYNGQGSPLSGGQKFVGLQNYTELFANDGLARTNFMTSLRNNFYYVLFVVPLQTVLALVLALVVNQKFLKAKGFFRTAFYFPSVTSSIAISVLFLFLFSNTGAVNQLLSYIGISGPQWFSDPRGLFQVILDKVGLVDINNPPQALAGNSFLGLSWWDWVSGPSVALLTIMALVIWTTAGTFMLMFLAALQDIPVEVEEAALLDGTSAWERFRYVTLPQLRPVLFLVLTLGLIGTWQVFDQVYVMSQGNPAGTTLTPAYLSYTTAFGQFDYSSGAAIAFILFAIIIAFTLAQRFLLRDKDAAREKQQQRAARKRARQRRQEVSA